MPARTVNELITLCKLLFVLPENKNVGQFYLPTFFGLLC